MTSSSGNLSVDVQSMPVALLEFGLDGVVRAAAGAALQVPPEQLVGQSMWDLIQSDDGGTRLRRAVAGEAFTSISTWGGRTWQSTFRPLRNGDTLTGVAAVFLDVTSQTDLPQPGDGDATPFEAVLEAVSEGILVVNTDGMLTWANAGCSRLFGAHVGPGAMLRDLLDEVTADRLLAQMRVRPAGRTDRYELRLRNARGEVMWLLVSASTIHDTNGDLLGSVGVLTDITATKAEQRRLETAALTDSLTGVANRVALAERLEHALVRREAGVVAVLFCDVDRLKAVNDARGHAAGDALLREVARRISSVLRPEDMLARYGGDEFVVVGEDLDHPDEALLLAERIAAAVAIPLVLPGEELVPTLSIGVATAPPLHALDDLLAAADEAVYEAKRDGLGQVRTAKT